MDWKFGWRHPLQAVVNSNGLTHITAFPEFKARGIKKGW